MIVPFMGKVVRSTINKKEIPHEVGTTARILQNKQAIVFMRCFQQAKRAPETDMIRDLYFRGETFNYEMRYKEEGAEKKFKGIGEIQKINVFWILDEAVSFTVVIKVWIQDAEKDFVL